MRAEKYEIYDQKVCNWSNNYLNMAFITTE